MNMKKLFITFLLAIASFALASCKGDEGEPLKFAIDNIALEAGETKTVDFTVSSKDLEKVTAKSSDEAIVTVTIEGNKIVVVGVSKGAATITLAVEETNQIEILIVSVTQKDVEEPPIEEPDEEDPVLEVEGLDVWTETSYINVFKEDIKTRRSSEEIEILMVKNEYESAQVVVRSKENFTVNGVDFGVFKDENDSVLDNVEMRYNFVEYEYFTTNSPGATVEGNIKWGQGYYPDALSNNQTAEIGANEAHSIYLTVYSGKETVPGVYKGQVYLDTSLGRASVKATIEIVDVTMADSKEGIYDTYYWQLFVHGGIFAENYKDEHPEDIIVKKFGNARYTDKWWELMENFADMMKENRLNHLYVSTVQLLLDGGSEQNADGTYTFNWSRFDEFIEFFISRGVVKGLTSNAWLSGESLGLLLRDSGGRTKTASTKYNSADANNWYAQFMPAFYQHLVDKGWDKIWHQNLKDEPMTSNDLAIYDYIHAKKMQYMPLIPVGDPHERVSSGRHLNDNTNVEYLVPITTVYDDNRAFYDAAVASGKKLITYTCWIPTGKALNNLIDRPVWQGRSIAWFNYHIDAIGYLCWGLQNWYRPITDFALGDTAKIYMDVENNTYKSSIRMSAHRDGAEEFELLAMLGEYNGELAKNLALQMAADSKSNYESRPRQMAAIRAELIRELVKAKNGGAN